MKTKGKGKSESKKAIIGIALAAIMLASVFAGISASAVADNNNNTVDESVDDSGNIEVESQVEEEAVKVMGAGAGTLSVELGASSPSENIDNNTHENEAVFQLRFGATGESIRINNLTVNQTGSIPAPQNLTNISVWVDKNNDGKWDGNDVFAGYINGTTSPSVANDTNLMIELSPAIAVVRDAQKDVIICVNTTKFDLGKTIQMKLESFNATGMGSNEPATQNWIDPAPISSYLIKGTGNVTVSRGAQDVNVTNTEFPFVDAGNNSDVTNRTVIMQINFTAGIETSNLQNVTLQWNTSAPNAANSSNDIDSVYLVNDTNADGKWNTSDASEKIVTPPTSFTNNVGKLEITVPGENEIPMNANRAYLIVVNTTKTFWSNESLAVNITDFNATSAEGYIVSKEYSPKPLASNVTIGRAKIRVGAGKMPIYGRYPAGDNQVNLEIMQFNFTVTAGEVNITHIVLQANLTGTEKMESVDANNTWPRIWWDKNNDGYITPLINRPNESAIALNDTGNFNLSKELNIYGVNVSLITNLTIGGTEENITTGYDSQYVIIAFNTTGSKPTHGNYTKIQINRTVTGYNYTTYDTIAKTSLNDSSDYFNANALRAWNWMSSNPLNVSFDGKPPAGDVKALGGINIPVMQLNLTNQQIPGNPDIEIRSIIVTENGTANATMIKNVSLCIDTDGDGKYDGEPLNASVPFTIDNSSVILTPDTPIAISAPGSKYLLILVNTTDKFELMKTLRFNISNPSLDIYATGTGTPIKFGVTNHSETPLNSSELIAVGTISASLGANTPPDGTVSSEVNATFLPLMQLNFTAGDPEDVNVTGLTITWNGTRISGENATSSIGIANDTNANGEIDWDLGETVINETTFDGNTSVHDLSTWANVTKGNTSSILIYVNTTTATVINLSIGDTLAINISNPSTNYSAKGATSDRAINDTSTTAISSKRLTAYWTGEILIDRLALETDTIIKNETNNNVVLLRFNLTAKNETVNVTSMKIKGMGGINETGNVTGVALRTPADGNVISDRKDFETDDGYVNLTISPALIVVNTTEVDVIANITTTSLSAGDNITVGLYIPATDLKAVGYYSGVPIQNTTVTALSNITVVTGNVTVSAGTNTSATGPITAMNATFVSIMQLNFSATPAMEDVNITGINLTASGLSSDAKNDTWGVGIWNDKNNNGVIDAGDVELGNSTFGVNHTAVFTFHTNLTINGTASQAWANMTFNNTVVYVNTSNDFNVSDYLQVKLVSYNATGNTSGQSLTAFGVPITSNKLTGTGNLTVIDTGKPPNANIVAGVNYTVPVWQLNMSTNHENATLENITLWFNGTAAADIAKVDLYNDTNANATVDANETIIATNLTAIGADGKVILNLTKTIYINTTPVQSFLVTVNTTSSFKDNHTIGFNITKNSSADVRAKGVVSGIVMATNYTVPKNSSILTGKCSIDVYNTTQPTGPVYANQSAPNVEVLELNFSAPCCNVDIQNITLQESGTAKVKDDPRGVTNISVWYGSVCYNSTAQFATEDGSLVINTTGLKLNCLATNLVTIKVNTTDNLTTGQTLLFKVNRTFGTGYNATCNASQKTPYSNETGEINNTITVTAAVADTINLKVGWNFISVPKKLKDSCDTFGELFDVPEIDQIYAYDPTTTPSWITPAATDHVLVLDGYWMNATAGVDISLEYKTEGQTVPTTKELTGKKWNAIGFSDTTATTAENTLISIKGSWSTVLGWDATNQKYEDAIFEPGLLDNMNPKKGYWVWMTKNDTLSAISA